MGSWHRDTSPFFPLLSLSQSPCDPPGVTFTQVLPLDDDPWEARAEKSREWLFCPIHLPCTLAEHKPSTWGVTGYIWTAFIVQTHSWCAFLQTHQEVPSCSSRGSALVKVVLDGWGKRATSGTKKQKWERIGIRPCYLCPFGMPETFRETSQANCSRKQLFSLFPRF